ncbi:aa3-type cytochrome c oxidase subunit IV [Enterovirga sp. CN4-39]|uniref:aa3-type cytochrome c oxidase subunit IV n=1 Tax=Enterovirga sp. CN4-39 TaxID=3400910 RepID=UPI003C006F1F
MAQTSSAGNEAYRPEMDGPAHESTYNAFTHFTAVGTIFVIAIVAALAVGGIKGAWISTLVMVVLAHIAAGIGLVSTTLSWRPVAAVLGVLLLMLLLY